MFLRVSGAAARAAPRPLYEVRYAIVGVQTSTPSRPGCGPWNVSEPETMSPVVSSNVRALSITPAPSSGLPSASFSSGPPGIRKDARPAVCP